MSNIVDITVPFEQEGTKAVVVNWYKQIGDRIELDEPLLELETDKVTQEIPSPATGLLVEILLTAGADAVPGAVLGCIQAQAPAEQTDSNAGASANIGANTATGSDTGSSTSAGGHQPQESSSLPKFNPKDLCHYSPSVRRAAQEFEIDPATVHGTGRGGRVTRADMQAAHENRDQPGVEQTNAHKHATQAAPVQHARSRGASFEQDKSAVDVAPLALIETGSGSHKVPHSGMRLAIAKHMSASVATAPHVTAVFEADWTAIMRHRERHKAAFSADGINLSYTAYLVAACVAAMREVPAINSRWHDDGLEIFDDINIGIGTALGDKGLVVPVIHDAQNLSLIGIARKLQEITVGARNGTLSGNDVRGGTFTISNHGVSGSLFASPIIINQPQSAILGVGKLEKRAVVREIDGIDAIQIRPMAYVSLTIDHRALDGHQTNAWLTRFVQTLEQWPL
jgi:2-oxoglutarate dehydrogenase E2 component (dihydrolipoamide succinyltransferase)